MDPLGFALENFDGIGRWRSDDAGRPIDPSGVLADGAAVDGPRSLGDALLARRDEFVFTVASKLLTYATGRGTEYYDAPAIRKMVKEAAADDYRWSSLDSGRCQSVPFQMRAIGSTKLSADVHHQDVAAPSDVPARSWRGHRAAAARQHGAGARIAARGRSDKDAAAGRCLRAERDHQMEKWTPAADGASFEITPTLEPLAALP